MKIFASFFVRYYHPKVDGPGFYMGNSFFELKKPPVDKETVTKLENMFLEHCKKDQEKMDTRYVSLISWQEIRESAQVVQLRV